jgi:hypothetical protein
MAAAIGRDGLSAVKLPPAAGIFPSAAGRAT